MLEKRNLCMEHTPVSVEKDQRAAFLEAEDTELMLAIEDNSSAFELLYQRHKNRIYHYLLARTGSQEDAADLTQTVFLRALEAHRQYRPQKGSFLSWLVAIARNSATNFLQRRRTTISWDYAHTIFYPMSDQDLEKKIIQQENLSYLRQLIRGLDAQKQELLTLRFIVGLTTAEIATTIGKTEAATKKRLSRILHALKEQYNVTIR